MKILLLVVLLAVVSVVSAGTWFGVRIFGLNKPAVLPQLDPQSLVIVGERTLDAERSKIIVSEINSLRTSAWSQFDGKANNPELKFGVKTSDASLIWFSLAGDEITQLRHGHGHTSGGYSRRFDLDHTPGIKQLREFSKSLSASTQIVH
jgi:hypothetical protein